MATRGAFSTFFYKHIYIVALILAVISGVLGYVFLISDQWQHLKEVQSGEAQNEALIERRLTLKKLKQFNSNYQELDSRIIETISDMLPMDSELPELYTQIESLAQENGVVILTLSVTELDNDEQADIDFSFQSILTKTVKEISFANKKIVREFDLRRMQIILKVGGSDDYISLKNFVTALQNNIRLMDVTSIRFEPRSEQYNIHLTTYYLQKKTNSKKE